MGRERAGQQSTSLNKTGGRGQVYQERGISRDSTELKMKTLGESGDGQIRMGEL